MAEMIDNSEFWFLIDEDILKDKKAKPNSSLLFSGDHHLPYGGPGYPAQLYSPADSAESSAAEAESDEEGVLAELTRRLAHSAIHDDPKLDAPENAWVLSGSPQSTLAALRSWSGSPNGPARKPPHVMGRRGVSDGWDAVFAAVGEVARLKVGCDALKYHQNCNSHLPQDNHRLVDHSPDLCGLTVPPPPPEKHSSDFYSNRILRNQFQNLCDDYANAVKQKRYSELEKYAKECVLRQWQMGSRERSLGQGSGRHGPPRRPSLSAWPTPKESSGTGVFLPRPYASPSESRRKQAHSSAARGDSAPPTQQQLGFNRSISLADYEFMVARRNALLVEQQKRTMRQEMAVNNEIRLPQEWTY